MLQFLPPLPWWPNREPQSLATERGHLSFPRLPLGRTGSGGAWGKLSQVPSGQQLMAISGPPWTALQQPSSLPLCPGRNVQVANTLPCPASASSCFPRHQVGPLTCSPLWPLCRREAKSSRSEVRDFPGGPAVKSPPCNAGEGGSIPGWGAKISHTVAQISQCVSTRDHALQG